MSARAKLTMIESSLAFYHMDNGVFPTTEQGLAALVARPEIPPVPPRYPDGGYFKRRNLLIDPWGTPFRYEAAGDSYRVYTLGADGVRGGEGVDADRVAVWGAGQQTASSPPPSGDRR